MVGKIHVCDEYCCLKIQCSLVLGRVRQGVKCKAESDMEKTVQPKSLKLAIEASGMRAEPTTQEVHLEHLELLGDLWELFRKQFELFETQLEEIRGF